MENYKEYRNKLFEAFMDAEHPKEEVEYEEVEVEPVFLISEDEELTEENTAVIIEDDELSEELLSNERYAMFQGNKVIVDKHSGVITRGNFKGKRVNLVKDYKKNFSKAYKHLDNLQDKAKNMSKSLNPLKRFKGKALEKGYEMSKNIALKSGIKIATPEAQRRGDSQRKETYGNFLDSVAKKSKEERRKN